MTSPYHPLNKANLAMLTVKYGTFAEEHTVPFENMVDSGSLDDEEKRLKLSHHPDGFIQFSGQGIISGKDEEGKPRGIGIYSWALNDPIPGPAFGITLLGLEEFCTVEKVKGDTCIFHDNLLPPDEEANGYVLEAYYFPSNRRRFIQTDTDGNRFILNWHPTHCVMKLNVLLPMKKCKLQGFIGVHLYPLELKMKNETCAFWLGSSTGNMRFTPNGDRIAEGLYCFYPEIPGLRSRKILNYQPE